MNSKPRIGDLVSLHSPEGDAEVVDLGIVTQVYGKPGFKEHDDGYRIYAVVGKYGKACEYDEPFWEVKVVNRVE